MIFYIIIECIKMILRWHIVQTWDQSTFEEEQFIEKYMNTKRVFLACLLGSSLLLTVPAPSHAIDSHVFNAGGIGAQIENKTSLGNQNPVDSVGFAIDAVLGFLGIIALGLFLYAGFKWMTAGGNEDAVTEAKTIIKVTVIGLLIILSGWSIARTLIQTANKVTNSQVTLTDTTSADDYSDLEDELKSDFSSSFGD